MGKLVLVHHLLSTYLENKAYVKRNMNSYKILNAFKNVSSDSIVFDLAGFFSVSFGALFSSFFCIPDDFSVYLMMVTNLLFYYDHF